MNYEYIIKELNLSKEKIYVLDDLDNIICDYLKGKNNQFYSTIFDFGNNFDIDLNELDYYLDNENMLIINYEIEEESNNEREYKVSITNIEIYKI